jgi:hypothetical protein
MLFTNELFYRCFFMQIEYPLVNELQCGNRLNQAIEHDRRGEFGLILAMLSADARDLAQFQLDIDLTQQQKFEKQFDLPKAQAVVADLSQALPITDNAAYFYDGGMRSFQLAQALTPEALVIRGRNSDAMALTLSNCDLTTRLRQQRQLPAIPDFNQMHFIDQLAKQKQISATLALSA